jgi:phosphoglucosamine mutase
VPIDQLPAVAAAITKIEQALGDDGRVLVRYSGTEPKARVMIEGTDEKVIRAYAEDIAQHMRKELAAR